MLYITSMLCLGDAPALPCPLDDDSRDRMMVCLQAGHSLVYIKNPNSLKTAMWSACRPWLSRMR